MHICYLNFCIERYSPKVGGAVSTVVMEEARELERRGHRVTVITPVEGEPYPVGDVIPARIECRETLPFWRRRLSTLERRVRRFDWHFYEFYLRSALRKLAALRPAPEAVVVENDLILARHVRRLLPYTRLIVHLHNELDTNQRSTDLRRMIDGVDVFLCVSRHIAEWTAARHDVPRSKLAVLTNGIDEDRFTPRPGYLEPADPVRVLYIGRLDPNKGPQITADAVAAARAQGRRVELTVAGGRWFGRDDHEEADPFVRDLKRRVIAAEGERLGFVERGDVPSVIRGHDVVCVLSLTQDPNPLVCLEAMASGCAVLGADRGGIPDACGDSALLVDPEDTAAVHDALFRLVDDPSLLADHKRRGRRHAERSTWRHHVDRLERIVTGHSDAIGRAALTAPIDSMSVRAMEAACR